METGPLKGLAKVWESTDAIRRKMLWHGCLLTWTSSEAVGCANYATAIVKFEVLKPLFERWVMVTAEPRAMSVTSIAKQARYVMQYS